MRFFCVLLLLATASPPTYTQGSESLPKLIEEAIKNNPSLHAARHQREVAEARYRVAGSLADPELIYFRKDMPDFQFNKAMAWGLEFMQMIMFPSKLSAMSEMAAIGMSDAELALLEKTNELVMNVRAMYYDLWFIQQSIVLNNENARLLKTFTDIALTKYGVGETTQPDVLKAYVEESKIQNHLIALRQKELSMKAELTAMLNRHSDDTLGVASLPGVVGFDFSLDSLRRSAELLRPMLRRDSLMIEESKTMLTLMKREYLPDFKIGVEYMRDMGAGMNAWTVRAGITLPFAPWTLGKAAGRVEEATAAEKKSRSMLENSRAMIRASIDDQFHKITSLHRQLMTFTNVILPQTEQALEASLTGYKTGTTNFLHLIDSYRMLVDMEVDALMLRMEYERSIAQLEFAVGAPYSPITERE